MKLFKLLIGLSLSLASLALAQDLTSEEVVKRIEDTATSIVDASFTVSGQLSDVDGSDIPIEIEGQLIPDLRVARAVFIQPQELADNFIVLDDQTVFNYVFLTNQATMFSVNDPDALGGLFPDIDPEQEFDYDLSLERLFVGWDVSIESYGESPLGNIYTLRLDNQSDEAEVGHAIVSVVDGEWIPYQASFFRHDGSLVSEVEFSNFVKDQGLEPDEVAAIPEDAELIDER